MNNIIENLSTYVIALIIELIVFFGFLLLTTSITNSEVSRRWKGASLISVSYGLLFHLLILFIFIFEFLSWIFKTNLELILANLPEKLILLESEAIALAAVITMPMIIVGVFIAYLHLWQTGDRFIEKYWKNPKIHYAINEKPPYLKF